MLTRLVVAAYAGVIEISLWLALLLSGVAGYYYAAPLVEAAGWTPKDEAGWRVWATFASVLGMFWVLTVFAGPVLVLLDIRKSMRALEAKAASMELRLPAELKEPTL
jgi:hypothetical protein